jgi:FkbM family methyltransferase
MGVKNSVMLTRFYQHFVSLHFKDKFNENLTFRGANFIVGKDLSLYPSISSGDFESKELNIILAKNFQRDSILWDVGANVGIWSVLLAKEFSSCKIISFEPQKAAQRFLQKNISNNHLTNVEVMQIGLGASVEKVELRTPKEKSGSSSIVLLQKEESDQVELIDVTTADSFLVGRPDLVPSFIKIDIEGYEPRMISGAHDLIANNHPIIMLEVFPKLWNKESTSEWEATLDFLMKVYNGGLICDTNGVSNLSSISFSKLGSRQRNIFFGL